MSLYNEITKLSKIKTKSYKVGEINTLLLTSKESIVAVGFTLEEDLSVAISSNPMLFNNYLWGEKRLMNTIKNFLPQDSYEEIIRWDGLVFFMNESLIFFARIGDEFIDLKPEQDLINFYGALKDNFPELKSPKEQMESELVDLGYEVDMLNIELNKVSNKNNSIEIELNASKEKCSKLENKLSSVEYQNEELKKEIEELKKLTLFHDSKNKKNVLLSLTKEQVLFLKNRVSIKPTPGFFIPPPNYEKYLEIEVKLFEPSILMGFESPIFAEWEKSGDWQMCGIEKKYLIIDVNGNSELITLEKISNQFSFSGFLNERSSTKIISLIGSVNFTIDEILDL